eukprot:s573_g9.t1
MLEQPLMLLTAGVVAQGEALGWKRARFAVTSASAVGIALASHAVWSTNHAGLNKLRQQTWLSAAIFSTSSWLHFEIGNPASYVSIVYLTAGHVFLALLAFADARAEPLFTQTLPMQRLRRVTRLGILTVTVAVACATGVLPQLLAVHTGAFFEKDLQTSSVHTVTTDSCALFVRTVNCSGCDAPPAGSPNRFQEGVISGRLKIWGSGKLLEQNSNKTVIAGTDFETCELWLLVPTHAVFAVECNDACTLHADGVFDGSLVATVSAFADGSQNLLKHAKIYS